MVSPQIIERWHQRLANGLAAGAIVIICACVVGLGLYREAELRTAEIATAENEARNLSRSLLQHAEDSVELVDNALIGLVHWLETEGFRPAAMSRLQRLLYLRKSTLPRLRGLFVYAADGSWLATSETVNIAGHNNADRAYFQHHRQSPDRAPLIGEPVRSRSGGQWIITVSRRINGADGAFAGVVLASMDVDYFVRSYSRFEVGAKGSLALLTPHGTLLARYPFDDAIIGRNFAGSPFMANVSDGASGIVHFRSVLDGVERISAYDRSNRYPLLMMVARGKDEVLASWWAAAQWRMGLVLALTLVIGLLGGIMVRELMARQRLLKMLSAREADFRMLAESSSDMVTRSALDGTLTYVSPSSLRIIGWSPRQLLGSKAIAGLDDEDRTAVESIVAEVRRGVRADALVAYRARHRTSGTVWLESALSASRDPETGDIDGIVAVSRDVTKHKQIEGHLSRLAKLDSLTGLANRRFLDDRADRELAAARVSGKPLAVLLIDADHFKLFNDTYGHQAGDQCLQHIAAVIQNHATRPGDLAARYGGEEFALLLADTDLEGARIVAERVCNAVESLMIPHAGNSAGRFVTISLGGAALDTGTDLTFRDAIRVADEYLYSAKAAGRNQARIGPVGLTTKAPPLQPAQGGPVAMCRIVSGRP